MLSDIDDRPVHGAEATDPRTGRIGVTHQAD
jgi:hypothetical protein